MGSRGLTTQHLFDFLEPDGMSVFVFERDIDGNEGREMMSMWRRKTAERRRWRLGMRMISMVIPPSSSQV